MNVVSVAETIIDGVDTQNPTSCLKNFRFYALLGGGDAQTLGSSLHAYVGALVLTPFC